MLHRVNALKGSTATMAMLALAGSVVAGALLVGDALAQTATTAAATTATTTSAANVSAAPDATVAAANVGSAGSGVTDPGVRGGAAGAGGPLQGLTSTQLAFFNAVAVRFLEVDSVSGNAGSSPNSTPPLQADETGSGLGPRFNLNACAGCHVFPAIGGGSSTTNPQISVATLDGAKNTIPSFISINSPIREARFVNVPGTNTPDGGVHDLFVITGRVDASGCNIVQPNFPQAVAQNNVIFRIPISVFGDGLIENTPDNNLTNAVAGVAKQAAGLGITGHFNTSGNDGTITKFGWKAQNKSLLIFAGEAYNVEQGVTNENFTNSRDDTAGCQFNPDPEDATNLTISVAGSGPQQASDFSSDIVNFASFMRLLAAPTPAAATAATTQGLKEFENIGCGVCHIQNQTTANSIFQNQSLVTYSPFSDFQVHDMGVGLQDRVSQGNANGQQFRSAPLFGVGQRVFFLHDGRTNNIVTAIEDHASKGSEANQVIKAFNQLSATNQQDIIAFLRSL
jgi:CxxC motif-containing protein (DUF1111 family)